MTENDFPALYRAADEAAARAQTHLLRAHKVQATLLIAGATVALLSPTTATAILSTVLFLGSLGAHVYLRHEKLQSRWYQARALAESVKTATWRLAMAADPFSQPNDAANLLKFNDLLSELLNQNRTLGGSIAGEYSKGDQITDGIRRLMAATFATKRSEYLTRRIDDQRDWYARRAEENGRQSSRSFTVMVCAYAFAILFLLLRISYPAASPYLPVQPFAVFASSLVAWSQLRRYEDLRSSYGLTAHEVGIIKARFDSVQNPAALSAFVSDAENAFSREHTQWAARRDH